MIKTLSLVLLSLMGFSLLATMDQIQADLVTDVLQLCLD